MNPRLMRIAAGAVTLTAMAAGGAAIGNAASSRSAATTTTTPAATPAIPAHGAATHEDAEKPVTGDNAAEAQAAAVKSLGGGTAGAVTTDLPGTGYEVTVTKADGTTVEVHLDSNFTLMQGGPGGHGFGGPAHGSPAEEANEKPVTGDAATKAKAAAIASVGSGTAGDVTTDSSGNGYEVTVTKADGSSVEVHLDSSFTLMQGGPGGHFGGPRFGGPGGPGAANGSTSTGTIN